METLRRFPGERDLYDRLAALGLVGEWTTVDGWTPADAAELIEWSGRCFAIPERVDHWPVWYDMYLTRGAALVPDLKGAVFDRVPPVTRHQDPYILRGYFNDSLYSLKVEDKNRYVYPNDILGLINVMCRDVGSNVRLVLIDSIYHEVFAASQEVIKTIEEEDLVPLERF